MVPVSMVHLSMLTGVERKRACRLRSPAPARGGAIVPFPLIAEGGTGTLRPGGSAACQGFPLGRWLQTPLGHVSGRLRQGDWRRWIQAAASAPDKLCGCSRGETHPSASVHRNGGPAVQRRQETEHTSEVTKRLPGVESGQEFEDDALLVHGCSQTAASDLPEPSLGDDLLPPALPSTQRSLADPEKALQLACACRRRPLTQRGE